jgi:cytochrome c oxidase subunit I+III
MRRSWAGAALNMAVHRRRFVFAAGVALLFFADSCARCAGPRAGRQSVERADAGMAAVRRLRHAQHPAGRHRADPLWDQPGLAAKVEQGRTGCPAPSPAGAKRMATSPVAAEPRYLLVLPGDSWLPFMAAAGTAGFFLLLTVKLRAGLALRRGGDRRRAWLAVASDRPPPLAEARVADGVVLPVGAQGADRTPGGPPSSCWWSTPASSLPWCSPTSTCRCGCRVCPPPGARLPPMRWPLLSCGLLALGSALVLVGRRRLAKRRAALAGAGGLAARWRPSARPARLCGAPACRRPSAAGAPRSRRCQLPGPAHRGCWLVADPIWRARWRGRLTPASRATLDNIALIWHYTTLQGVLLSCAVYAMPLLKG